MASVNTKRNNNTEANDLYSTPLVALQSFYNQYPEVFDRYDVYYDPCNGLGVIADFLRGLGKTVHTGDLIDYGVAGTAIEDFLEVTEAPEGTECIVFNPPFKLTREFVNKALELCPNLIMFNRLTTLETSRAGLFKSGEWPLDCAYIFGFRVSCPEGVEMKPTANSVAYAWYVFNKDAYCSKLRWIV